MSPHGGPSVMGGAAGKSHRPGPAAAAGQPRPFDPGPWWMRVLPPVVMLAIALADITRPSFWRDEAATLAAVQRPFTAMLAMLGHVDAVHGAYYVLAWADYRVLGHGELAMRVPSALAMCVAAGFVAALGLRLVSPLAGLLAGLTFAVLPQVSFYGQDARSYAFVTAMAAIASYLLVRVLPTAAAGPEDSTRAGRWWIGYAISVGLLGILNIFALLLIPAHAVTVALRCWRPPAGQSRRGLALRWLAAAVVGAVLASPLLYLGFTQKGQVSWLKTPDWLNGVNQLIGPMTMLAGALLAVAAGLAISAAGGRARLRACWPAGLDQLALPWLILPPALLLAGSLITPVYTFRYILFCTPAAALIVGTALAAIGSLGPAVLGRIAAAAVLIIVAALGLHAQLLVRRVSGHKDDLRHADRIIARLSRPGDVVLYTNPNAESFPAAYPYGLDKLRNIQLARRPVPSATLGGTNAPEIVVRNRLAHVSRVWVVNINTNQIPVPLLHGLHYQLVQTYRASDIWLRLYVRSAAAGR